MKRKLQTLKKQLYFIKQNILFEKALKNGKITSFDKEIFEKMSNTIIACLPVSFYIKYSNYLFSQGTCYERSLYMFLALDNALLVRGSDKTLEYIYGKDHDGHGWIEIDNFVYDPALMLKFDKDVYYALYGCTNVIKISKKTYLEKHKDFVNAHVSYDFNDFRPQGKRRLELGILIKQVRLLGCLINDENFTNDLNTYLSLIEYDEKEIREEREKVIQKILTNEQTMSVVCGKKV